MNEELDQHDTVERARWELANRQAQIDELIVRLTYHPPTENQRARHEMIRERALAFATFLVDACPMSREQSLAFTAIEEAVYWASAAIARRETR